MRVYGGEEFLRFIISEPAGGGVRTRDLLLGRQMLRVLILISRFIQTSRLLNKIKPFVKICVHPISLTFTHF